MVKVSAIIKQQKRVDVSETKWIWVQVSNNSGKLDENMFSRYLSKDYSNCLFISQSRLILAS